MRDIMISPLRMSVFLQGRNPDVQSVIRAEAYVPSGLSGHYDKEICGLRPFLVSVAIPSGKRDL